MNFPLDEYAKIKDKYLICHLGHSNEYIVILKIVRPMIEKEFPGLKVYIGYNDNLLPYIEGQERTIPVSYILDQKSDFSFIKELKTDFETNPILTMLEDAKVPIEKIPVIESDNKKCVIMTNRGVNAEIPNELIKKAEIKARLQGYQIEIDGDWKTAGWVIGGESEMLYEAVYRKMKTTLIPNGTGTKLYQMLGREVL